MKCADEVSTSINRLAQGEMEEGSLLELLEELGMFCGLWLKQVREKSCDYMPGLANL